MINEKNVKLGEVRSGIRELFEYGKLRKSQIGEEDVYDFSLCHPSVPPPERVTLTLQKLLAERDPVELHGYTSAQGDLYTRQAICGYVNKTFGAGVSPDLVYMTCGAAASLTITLNAICNSGDEVLTFAPFFPEYTVFADHAGAKLVPVATKEGSFRIDFDNLERAIKPETKAVIINSPNNPSGVVYSEEEIKKLCATLAECGKKYGTEIYLISDEPYRELVYDDIKVPYIMNYYDKSIVCYSYSKSLSLPGDRIGYIAVNPAMTGCKKVYSAICGAGRALGYVCAPSLLQKLVAEAQGVTSDISVYKSNRDLLCSALTEFGYDVVKPEGAFYLFVKAMEADANAFAERAKKYELLIVPGDSFGVKGYVRISYCVSPEMIKRSLPSFKALAESYKK
ncbi:MAG: pyridoxal phosphate-dependent aminotransferase [Clostridia bacterium]|nr:pyridoxal phosphate-dependent aminotransferase [Clostridia bacterium]